MWMCGYQIHLFWHKLQYVASNAMYSNIFFNRGTPDLSKYLTEHNTI